MELDDFKFFRPNQRDNSGQGRRETSIADYGVNRRTMDTDV